MRPHLEDLRSLHKAYITHKGKENQVPTPGLIFDKEAMLIVCGGGGVCSVNGKFMLETLR